MSILFFSWKSEMQQITNFHFSIWKYDNQTYFLPIFSFLYGNIKISHIFHPLSLFIWKYGNLYLFMHTSNLLYVNMYIFFPFLLTYTEICESTTDYSYFYFSIWKYVNLQNSENCLFSYFHIKIKLCISIIVFFHGNMKINHIFYSLSLFYTETRTSAILFTYFHLFIWK